MTAAKNKRDYDTVRMRRWRKDNPEKNLLVNARNRARSLGVLFALTAADIIIPKTCPAIGIPIKHGIKRSIDSSPTIDRFVPRKGYVPGNVAVISYKANAMKRNATPEQIRALATWVEKKLESV